MADLKGKRVLITGAACGLGRSLAELFIKAGSEMILTDINESALNQTVEELREKGASVHSYTVDIANRKKVEQMAMDILKDHGHVDILINNAGIGHNGEIVETSLKTWKELMDVNFWGMLYHIYAFLPSMIKAETGHIVNISSGQAFFRLPTWGPYAIIKLAQGAFSELLRIELKKFKIKVTTVYPYMINTGFYREVEGDTLGSKLSMKLLPFYSMTPERVAKIVFKAVKKRKPVEMVSRINDIGFISRSITPLANLISTLTLMSLGKNCDTLKNECELLKDSD